MRGEREKWGERDEEKEEEEGGSAEGGRGEEEPLSPTPSCLLDFT